MLFLDLYLVFGVYDDKASCLFSRKGVEDLDSLGARPLD